MFRLIKNICNCSTLRKLLPQNVRISNTIKITNHSRSLSSSTKYRNVYLVDENNCDNIVNTDTKNINKYTNRTHTCGELTCNNIGETVTLCGWLEYQRMNKFIVLRDSYGETQLIISDKDIETQKQLNNIPFESIIEVNGTVLSRPKEMINPKQKTGQVEVVVDKLKVVNKAKTNLPFNIREFQKAKEPLRMQYRYLDLRFPQMQRNLRVRSQLIAKMREFLINNHFVDVETPTLFKATPGGAQEFVVPTRFPGQFYSLVQSPQQFKQTLMAGGIDRYFQIARCYRDEGSRADRQPEFTQLDIEMSFTTLDDVMKLIEELLSFSWPNFLNPLPLKFNRMTYNVAMEEYGTDQPDLRYDFKIKNCTDIVKLNEKLMVKDSTGDFGAFCLVFPKEYAILSKSLKEEFSKIASRYSSVKLVQNKVPTSKVWISKVSKLLSNQVANKLAEEMKLQDESVMILAYGKKHDVLKLLGTIRVEYVNTLEDLGISIKRKGMHFLWVYDFPLFETNEIGQLQSAHHPFTAPHPNDLSLLQTNPLKVRALSYDLVLNGNEIGGGSIRIHDPILQETVLKMLQIDINSMKHLLEMLTSGCPPHGGIALGLDRLLAMILNTTSIRDVIAFPKTFEGRDPLSGAPSPISEEDEKLYHIKSIKNS